MEGVVSISRTSPFPCCSSRGPWTPWLNFLCCNRRWPALALALPSISFPMRPLGFGPLPRGLRSPRSRRPPHAPIAQAAERSSAASPGPVVHGRGGRDWPSARADRERRSSGHPVSRGAWPFLAPGRTPRRGSGRRQTTSGCAVASQSSRLASRLLTLWMLKVAIRIAYPRSPRACSASWISGA